MRICARTGCAAAASADKSAFWSIPFFSGSCETGCPTRRLAAAGVGRFDDWAATFGKVTTQHKQSATGELKLKTAFSKFANLPELMSMYKEFADIQSAKKLDLPRPSLKTGKPQIISVPASPEQKAFVKALVERAKRISEGSVDPHDDNMLVITNEARLTGLCNAAVAALLQKHEIDVPEGFTDAKTSKVDVCVDKVPQVYQETATQKGVQIVFSDVAVNSDAGNFSVYDYIRDELIAKGIPEEEIIFAPIHYHVRCEGRIVKKAVYIAIPTGQDSGSSMGNGETSTSRAGTLCVEWICRQTPFTAVCVNMNSVTASPNRPLLDDNRQTNGNASQHRPSLRNIKLTT